MGVSYIYLSNITNCFVLCETTASVDSKLNFHFICLVAALLKYFEVQTCVVSWLLQCVSLINWTLDGVEVVLKVCFQTPFYKLISWTLPVKFVLGGYNRASLMSTLVQVMCVPLANKILPETMLTEVICHMVSLGPHRDDWHFVGLVQDCSNSSALAMEILQSCTKPSISFKCFIC